MVVVERGVELVRPVAPAAIDDHHNLCAGCAEDRHHLVHILPHLLGSEVRHHCREDLGGAILDRPQDAEQHPARESAPGALASPRLAFAGFVACDLTLAQRAGQEACPLGFAPPAHAGQGKAPHDRFVFREQDDLTSTCAVFQGGERKRALGEISWGGSKATRGAVGAQVLFFHTPRMLARPRRTPVCWASTVASSRQLHWAWMEPCGRGS
jgi:hypothetical protein